MPRRKVKKSLTLFGLTPFPTISVLVAIHFQEDQSMEPPSSLDLRPPETVLSSGTMGGRY
jgi:hypothetical protein